MVKIHTLEVENLKRVRSCQLTPSPNGLTIIGGRNGQGKTSVLDAIAWALGGEKYRPTQAQREGSVLPPRLKVTLSNGLVVERAGKNSALKVTDPAGRKAGQQLLNEFIEQLALDLPKFLNASSREKAEILLKVIGVGDQLLLLDRQAKDLYNQRHALGQIADMKAKFAQELPEYPGLPEEPVSAMELIQQQQDILARNGENQRKRDQVTFLSIRTEKFRQDVDFYEKALAEARDKLAQAEVDLETAQRTAEDLRDESTAELEESIRSVDELNRKIRANLDREKALSDAEAYKDQYDQLTRDLEEVRSQRLALLRGAKLPLPGLSVEDGQLTYQGKNWDGLSGSDQLKVAAAIARAVNPQCGFVLMDKLEQMDLDTLREFGDWLEGEGLQVIATRVSTGGECSILIEDGYVVGQETPRRTYQEGVF